MMQYTNAQSGNAGTLKQKVKQEKLPTEMADKILKELGSPIQARACLELLETCISFLLATGGSLQVTIHPIAIACFASGGSSCA